jgi:L-alanine-DL-glutamate epimerase-like enolase superfamily enzyme
MMLHFDLNGLDNSVRLEEISRAEIPYQRPRSAGKNARLDTHGRDGEFPGIRIRAGGVEGFGWCTLTRPQAELLIGIPLRAMFLSNGMLRKEFRALEFPLLDWIGHFFHKPVYELTAKNPDEVKNGFSVPVYDTTIYFDELHIRDNKEAVDYILAEVSQGMDRGFRDFKIKIGRCGMWMDLEDGLKRDVDVVNGIRRLTGPKSKLMTDANNGYNLNIAKKFLSAVRESHLYWIEEAFHEDNILYTKLKEWMREQGIKTLIADGEGYACQALLDWAKKGIIDVIQYDLRSYGFFNWMELSEELEPYDILFAPHNYGGFYGNYAQAHFAAATGKFTSAEFDIADAEGIDTSAYKISEGRLEVSKTDGFGLLWDSAHFTLLRDRKGYQVSGG